MRGSQCPVCFSPLAVREVTPCYLCGGWEPMVERFDPTAVFREYRLLTGRSLVLCHGCELEEFMVPGGWGWRLDLPSRGLPIDHLQPIRSVEDPRLGKDKFCDACNLRSAFLEILAEVGRGHAS